MPQPLFVPWAAPIVAPRLWPWQLADVLDMTLQPVMLAFGAPLVVIPTAPLPPSANRQYGVEPDICTAAYAEPASALTAGPPPFMTAGLAVVVVVVDMLLVVLVSPLKPITCDT